MEQFDRLFYTAVMSCRIFVQILGLNRRQKILSENQKKYICVLKNILKPQNQQVLEVSKNGKQIFQQKLLPTNLFFNLDCLSG